VQLAYQQWGTEGIPILGLHGHPGQGECLEVFADSLAGTGQFHLVAPDLRGYGRSQVRDPYTLSAHLEDLEALIHSRGWQRFGILGWSLGGILALELALKLASNPRARQPYSATVIGLTLIASSACPQGSHPPVPWWMDVTTALASLLNLLLPGHSAVIALGQNSLYRYLIARHTPKTYRYLARYAVSAYLRTSSQAHQALRESLRHPYNRLRDLSGLGIPTLVLAGCQDVHITPESSQRTAAALPQATWKQYEGVAHLFPWEIPEQVNQDLVAWWQGLAATLEKTSSPSP